MSGAVFALDERVHQHLLGFSCQGSVTRESVLYKTTLGVMSASYLNATSDRMAAMAAAKETADLSTAELHAVTRLLRRTALGESDRRLLCTTATSRHHRRRGTRPHDDVLDDGLRDALRIQDRGRAISKGATHRPAWQTKNAQRLVASSSRRHAPIPTPPFEILHTISEETHADSWDDAAMAIAVCLANTSLQTRSVRLETCKRADCIASNSV